MTDKRCGTCKHFVLGWRSFCGWKWYPGAQKLSSAYQAGGDQHAMWTDDGKYCETWENESDGSHVL